MYAISRATVPAAVTSKSRPATATTRYAIVGTGWRSTVFLRLAYLMPDRFQVTGVVARREASGQAIERNWGAPAYSTLEGLLAAGRPDFVIISVPWPVTPELIRKLVDLKLPVLAETPPAPDLAGLHTLWQDVGAADLVQIAEQYALMPLHAARLAITRTGLIGDPTSVLVSSTHNYHAVSLMRQFLQVDAAAGAIVTAQRFRSALVNPITPDGWTHDSAAKPADTLLAAIDFGDGGIGRYDFTDNQWWNPLRPDHLLIRGSAGEIADDLVVRLADPVTPLTSRIERAQTGWGMNYEGLDLTHLSLDGTVIFRNDFEGARLSDDDIGVAVLLDRMGAWVRGEGDGPYPLRDGCQDHAIGLAIEEAAQTGRRVAVGPQPWT